jgi:hypothetical protein
VSYAPLTARGRAAAILAWVAENRTSEPARRTLWDAMDAARAIRLGTLRPFGPYVLRFATLPAEGDTP